MSATLKNIIYNSTTIPVVFEESHSLPIFNLQLVFKNSGYITDKQKHGITNITAKLLSEGTKKDGAVNFARKLENDAIEIETSTGTETFVIEISCLATEYKQALKYLEEILKNPNITNDSLEKVKNLTLSKLQQKQNDFDYVASTGLKSMIFKNTPLEFSKTGTIQSIKDLTTKDIKQKLNSILNINNLIVVVGGDIKFKEFKKQLTPILTHLKDTKVKNFDKISVDTTSKYKEIKKETQQSYIYFASPFDIKYNSKNNYKAKVASFILGGSGFGSRLMEEIRVKNGLAYSAYGYISNKKSHSYFTGYLQTKLSNTTKAKDMVKKIVKDFVKNGVTKEELEAAKKFLSGSEPLRTETFSQRLNRAFYLYYKGLPFDYPQKELQQIESLSLEELNNFIKSHKEMINLSFCIVTK